jgi:dTDP-4-amino-4,6-dideoxygalactose transaminase
MTDVSAAIGIHQLAKLDGWIERRNELASRYDELLSDLPLELERPLPAGARHARHLYTVRVRPGAPGTRDELITALHEHRIGSSVHFRPIHRFRYYRERYGLDDRSFPAASGYADRVLSLPLFAAMTEEDQEDVAAVLEEVLA